MLNYMYRNLNRAQLQNMIKDIITCKYTMNLSWKLDTQHIVDNCLSKYMTYMAPV